MLPSCVVILYIDDNPTFLNDLQPIITNHLASIVTIFIVMQIFMLEHVHQNNKRYDKHKRDDKRDIFETYENMQHVTDIRIFKDIIKDITSHHKPADPFLHYKKTILCRHLSLLTISNMVIIFIYIFYILGISRAIILLSSGIAFLIITNVVFSVGHSEAYRPKAKIHLKNGETIEGNLLKFGNYVSLFTNDKKYSINRDDISYIEEDKV